MRVSCGQFLFAGLTESNKVSRTIKLHYCFYTLQIINYQPYDAAVDWWALGVLTYEMLVGRVSLFCACYYEILSL